MGSSREERSNKQVGKNHFPRRKQLLQGPLVEPGQSHLLCWGPGGEGAQPSVHTPHTWRPPTLDGARRACWHDPQKGPQ